MPPAELHVRLRGSLAGRRRRGRLAVAACAAAAVVAAAPVVALLGYTAARGLPAVSFGFLVHQPTPPGVPGGGIANAVWGTARVVGLAVALAAPVGLAAASFLARRPGPVAGALRLGAEVLTGVPSIAVGIFAYAVVVRPFHHFSTVAGAVALAVLMLPVVVRADEEALAAVPVELWEAGVALGVARWRVLAGVVARHAGRGLATGNLLALARAVGETAPLLFVLGNSNALSLTIFEQGTQAFPAAQRTAWGAALVLLVAVLAVSVVARALARRTSRLAPGA